MMPAPPYLDPFLEGVPNKISIQWRQFIGYLSSIGTVQASVGTAGIRTDQTTSTAGASTDCFATAIKIPANFFGAGRIVKLESMFETAPPPPNSDTYTIEYYLSGALVASVGATPIEQGFVKSEIQLFVASAGASVQLNAVGGGVPFVDGSYAIYPLEVIRYFVNIDTTVEHQLTMKMYGTTFDIYHRSTIATTYRETT